MLTIDPTELVYERQHQLLAESEHERVVGLLPARHSGVRHGLAEACIRLATWLDAPAGYVQMPEPGPEDWVTPSLSV
jgi:hypothetical protein